MNHQIDESWFVCSFVCLFIYRVDVLLLSIVDDDAENWEEGGRKGRREAHHSNKIESINTTGRWSSFI